MAKLPPASVAPAATATAIIIFAICCCCSTLVPASERAALLDFKAQILSDPEGLLSSWVGTDCCSWAGITCSNRTGHIDRLELTSMAPSGGTNIAVRGISPSLLHLRHLTHLQLNSMDFLGAPIPEFLGGFKHLLYLDLEGSNFTGRVPPHIGNLSSLLSLSLAANDLYSTSLGWLSRLSSLRYLDLSSVDLSRARHWISPLNKLSSLNSLFLPGCNLENDPLMQQGSNFTSILAIQLDSNNFDMSIASFRWLWSMPSLEILLLQNNGFYGRLPRTLGNMTSIRILMLRNNSITGSLPDLGTLETLCNLQYVDFVANGMDGEIAVFLQRFPRCARHTLLGLQLNGNSFEGSLPSWMKEFRSLQLLTATDNNIHGQIPELPRSLSVLDLHDNFLSGQLPPFAGMQQLQQLVLQSNNITGSVPPSICRLKRLKVFAIAYNQLVGSIPRCAFSLALNHLDLGSNNLSGEFPLLARSCQQLKYFDLSYNSFSGVIPPWVAEIRELRFLVLKGNKFTGPAIPVELTKLERLQFVDVSMNSLSGSLSGQLMTFKAMTDGPQPGGNDYRVYLNISISGQELDFWYGYHMYILKVGIDLSYNHITGEIPVEIGNLVAIHSLDLSRNNFSGGIPDSIGMLRSLEWLDLSYNQLRGEIPSSLSALTFLSHLNLSYNDLSGRITSGQQLQALPDAKYIYIGNRDLCGPPTSTKCPGDDTPIDMPDDMPYQPAATSSDDDKMALLYGLTAGSIFGLWLVFCSFLFVKKWRQTVFLLVDKKFR